MIVPTISDASQTTLFPIGLILPFNEIYTLIQNNSNNHTNGTHTDSVPEWLGWIGVSVCIVTWGTFVLPMKAKWVRDVEFDPIVFQFYFSFVVFLLSLIVLAWNEWYFSWWAVLGSGIWVPSSLFSIVAVEYLGAAVGQGVWAGVVIITNFVWGVTFFESKIGNIYLTIFGLIIMVLGILGVATCSKWNTPEKSEKSVNQSINNGNEEENTVVIYETTPLFNNSENQENSSNINQVDNPIITDTDESIYPSLLNSGTNFSEILLESEKEIGPLTKTQKFLKVLTNSRKFLIGLVASFLCGITGGSMFVPSRLESDIGMVYMVGFGFGSFAITTLILIVYYIYYLIRFKKRIAFHPKLAIFPCITAVLWQIGNFFANLVSDSPLGLTIGMPLTETAMVITGICGLVFFKELRGWKSILQFFISAVGLIVPGCILLALYGKIPEVPAD